MDLTALPVPQGQFLARLDASLAQDVLTDAFTDADVAAGLREAGGDPAAIGRRGANLAQELLERRRLAWQGVARRKRDRALGLLAEDQHDADMAIFSGRGWR